MSDPDGNSRVPSHGRLKFCAVQHQILCAHQAGPVVTGAEGEETEARPHGWDYFRHGDQERLWGEGFISADQRMRGKKGMKNSS